MDFVEGQDREQMFISSIEQMVEPEAFVRIIDAFIDGLPLDQFDFKNLELNEQGPPPFHPGVLLKLYLYGYQNGNRSCRKLEHPCKVNLEVILLLKGRRSRYKNHWDLSNLLLKGKEFVLGEIGILFTTYNLWRTEPARTPAGPYLDFQYSSSA